VGTGGTGSFASGPITGFGSIVVGGVHFDESAARIANDDGTPRDRSELHLGTMVEIDSDEIRGGAATASQVRITSALIGAVESKAANALVANGQTVRIEAGTVFDERLAGGLTAIAVGRVLEVHGFVGVGSTEIVATRIEPKDGATAFKFRGEVAALDTQTRTFDIGGQHFSYAASVNGVGELRNGALVRIVVALLPDAQGRWVVNDVGATGPRGDRAQVKADGVITTFVSNASFVVAGYMVNASAAQIVNGPLAAGLRVDVDGKLEAGVLVAHRVRVEQAGQPEEFQLRGVIDRVDTAAKVFEFRGNRERVSFAGTGIVYQGGDEPDLASGRRVTAFGNLSADGTLVEATRIRFDD
jgi:Domain of unknown function (DUF5666)